MKKLKLRDWVINIILLNQSLLLIMLGADTTNLCLFLVSKLVIIILLVINHIVLCKYSNIFNED